MQMSLSQCLENKEGFDHIFRELVIDKLSMLYIPLTRTDEDEHNFINLREFLMKNSGFMDMIKRNINDYIKKSRNFNSLSNVKMQKKMYQHIMESGLLG